MPADHRGKSEQSLNHLLSGKFAVQLGKTADPVTVSGKDDVSIREMHKEFSFFFFFMSHERKVFSQL